MKSNFFSALVALCVCCVSFIGCSDDLNPLGESTRPITDGIIIGDTTYHIDTYTAYRDSVYVRTGYPMFGNITDPSFGNINAGYLAQFYVSSDFELNSYNSSDSVIFDILKTSVPKKLGYEWDDYKYAAWDSLCGNKLDSMTVRIYYNTFYGDSLTPMIASVYQLNKGLDLDALPTSEFYSNNNFEDGSYYNASNLLGKKAYTAANRELSDSIRGLSGYTPYFEVRLKDALKEKFFRAAVQAAVARDTSNPHHNEYEDLFRNSTVFRDSLLSGLCIKNTFGDGCIIKVYYTAVYFFYSSYHQYDVDGTLLRNEDDTADSTYVTKHVKYLAVTPDVVQMSSYQYDDSENKDMRLSTADTTYITSPQGYYTVVKLPVGKIINTMANHPMHSAQDSSYFLNGCNFYLQAFKPKGTLLSGTPAPYVLMVPKDDINTFFEDDELPDSETSCYASFVADSVNNQKYYYSFGNVNSLIWGLAKEKFGWVKEKPIRLSDDDVVEMAVIPVELTTNSTYGTVLSVSNYILPTAVRLKRGETAQSAQIIYTLETTNSSNK